MKTKITNSLTIIIPLICGVFASIIAVKTLIWWMERSPDMDDFVLSVPGLDQVPEGARNQHDKVEIGKFFKSFDMSCENLFSGQWPRFRGMDFSNVSKDNVELSDNWKETGPPVLWTIQLGEGHAAPVIKNGKVYILDYLEEERADALRCFCLLTGKELWRRWYNVDTKRNHGRSRTIPAVADGCVVTIGPKGHVMCVDAQTGDLKWTVDLVLDYGTEIPQWYTGQCPLVDGNTVVLAPGGQDALLIGVDAQSGKILWQTPNPDNWRMSHSSVIPMTLNGKKMYVYFALGGIAGVEADGEKAGSILWKTNFWTPSVVAPSPVILDEGRIYLTTGYGAGSAVIRIIQQGAEFKVQTETQFKPRDALALEQQSAIYYKNILFGIMPKDAGIRRQQLTACDPHDISHFITPVDNEMRFGLGPFIIADDKFYVLDDDGTLTMLKFEKNKFNKLAEFKVLNGHDAWGPLAVADGLMLLRDSTSVACIDLTKDERWSRNKGKYIE